MILPLTTLHPHPRPALFGHSKIYKILTVRSQVCEAKERSSQGWALTLPLTEWGFPLLCSPRCSRLAWGITRRHQNGSPALCNGGRKGMGQEVPGNGAAGTPDQNARKRRRPQANAGLVKPWGHGARHRKVESGAHSSESVRNGA